MSVRWGENPTAHPGQKDWSHGARISTGGIPAGGLLLPQLILQGQKSTVTEND